MTITGELFHLLLSAAGGAVGGAGRHWINGLVARRHAGPFPWGTLTVNVTGALLIGILAGLVIGEDPLSHPGAWSLVVTGGLGSYTTVSSFSLQSLELVREGELPKAVVNVALSFALCLAGATLGFVGVRLAGGW